MSQEFIVYLLLCKGNKIYTGYTKDLDNRFKLHCDKKGAKFTKCYPPIKILHTETFDNQGDAIRREMEIQKMTRKMKEGLCGTEI